MSESWFLDDDQLVHELRCAGGASAVPELRGYTDLAELARGGQGIVYTGRQSATGRLVAIKVLPARPSGGREARFDRELELLARLSAIGAAYADVLEAVDLNPVAVLPAGRGVRVLDALIIPKNRSTQ